MNTTSAKYQFWRWFKQNVEEYNTMYSKKTKDMGYWCDELEVHLRAYFPYTTFFLYNDSPTGTKQLIFSAMGEIRYFKKCDYLVAKAPVIPGWEFISLLPPRQINYMIEARFGDTGIDPYQIWFMPRNNNQENDRLDIIVYLEMYHPDLETQLALFIYNLIINVLGERSAVMDLGDMWLAHLSTALSMEALLPLEYLPFYINEMKSSYQINAEGQIVISQSSTGSQ